MQHNRRHCKRFEESAAYPGNIINIADYGFFLIDSHGTTSGGKSYMIMRKATPQIMNIILTCPQDI